MPTEFNDSRIFEAAISVAPVGIVITDQQHPDQPIVYCNLAFEKLTGYARDEIIGRNCRFLQGTDRDQPARDVLARAVREGTSCTIEMRNYKKNGQLFWNELTISPVFDPATGKVMHMMGFQNDITGRKDAEQSLLAERQDLERNVRDRTKALQEKEIFQTGIIETVRESLLVLDENIQVISVNHHFCQFFEVSKEEVIGKRLYDLENGAWDNPQLRELLERILPTQNPFEGFKVEHDFPGIGYRIMMLNARQITYEGDLQSLILLAMEDVTALVEADQRKDDFITVASHEMRTPLTSIIGYLQVIESSMQEDRSPLLAYASKCSAQANNLKALMNRLLDISRLGQGEVPANLQTFDFDDLVIKSLDIARRSAHDHPINLTGATLSSIHADFSSIQQVVLNLAGNAVKYSPPGSITDVTLGLDGNMVKLSVRDRGPGISKKLQKKIFDRFYRATDTRHSHSGLGMGLYISKMIVRDHGGRLWVESEEGQGSVFSFTLPTASDRR